MAKVQPQAFDEVNSAISGTLTGTYTKKRNSFSAAVAKKLDQNDYEGALDVVNKGVHLGGVFWSNRKRLRLLSAASMRFGQSRLADTKDLLYDASQDELMLHHVGLLKKQVESTEKYIKDAAFAAVEKLAVTGKVTKAEKVREFQSFIDKSAGAVGFNHLQLVSSLHNSRLAQYGFTVEAEVRDITFYAINAVLDGRTSDICKYMHGKVFPVEHAYEQSIKLLATDDPAELKFLAPWATNKGDFASMQSMTTGELMNAGWALPPFHPHCRTYIDEAGNTVEVDFSTQEVTVTPTTGTQPIIAPSATGQAEVNILDQFGIPLVGVGGKEVLEVVTDDLGIQDAANVWSLIPNLTLLEMEEIVKAIRSGEYDDFELMEVWGISFESLELIKGLLL